MLRRRCRLRSSSPSGNVWCRLRPRCSGARPRTRSLRAIARFTPAKRVRLGAAALSAALDADDGFRARVADAVAEATPQLVDAVQTGSATPASDPVDTAVVAYLTRPPGWAELVASVGEQWISEQSARDAAADEITRLRAEVSDLRSQLRT